MREDLEKTFPRYNLPALMILFCCWHHSNPLDFVTSCVSVSVLQFFLSFSVLVHDTQVGFFSFLFFDI